MHFDKDCGGPKNQTHGAGPAGQGKWLWYFGCARRLGYGPSTERVARVARHGPERSRLASPSQHQDHPARLFLSSCASSWHGGGGLKPTAQETLQTSLCPAGPAAATSLSPGVPMVFRARERPRAFVPEINASWRLHRSDLSHRVSPSAGGGGGAVGTVPSLELTSCCRTHPSLHS